MTFKNHFENVIINKDFETACLEAEKIVLHFLIIINLKEYSFSIYIFL